MIYYPYVSVESRTMQGTNVIAKLIRSGFRQNLQDQLIQQYYYKWMSIFLERVGCMSRIFRQIELWKKYSDIQNIGNDILLQKS